jgi:hypothetical protein
MRELGIQLDDEVGRQEGGEPQCEDLGLRFDSET